MRSDNDRIAVDGYGGSEKAIHRPSARRERCRCGCRGRPAVGWPGEHVRDACIGLHGALIRVQFSAGVGVPRPNDNIGPIHRHGTSEVVASDTVGESEPGGFCCSGPSVIRLDEHVDRAGIEGAEVWRPDHESLAVDGHCQAEMILGSGVGCSEHRCRSR